MGQTILVRGLSYMVSATFFDLLTPSLTGKVGTDPFLLKERIFRIFDQIVDRFRCTSILLKDNYPPLALCNILSFTSSAF